MAQCNNARRRFLQASIAAGTAALLPSGYFLMAETPSSSDKAFPKTTFSLDGRKIRIYTKSVSEPVRIMHISDTHLYIDDERGANYREYSERMSKAYNSTRNYKNGAETNPVEMVKQIVQEADEQDLDAIAMTGDIVSFPSAAGVDYVLESFGKLSIPRYYISGNHDWHFEGMRGTERDLRDEWIEKRLKPLYPTGVNPLCYSVKVKGVKLLFVDDSIYEILPEQLAFIQKELSTMEPTAVFMHIPLYAPGRPVSFGVGHPNWNASTDGNYKIEQRPQWPEKGHNETTFAFRDAILGSPNLLGVFQGHIHRQSLDICEGKPLHVTPTASDGSTTSIEILPL